MRMESILTALLFDINQGDAVKSQKAGENGLTGEACILYKNKIIDIKMLKRGTSACRSRKKYLLFLQPNGIECL